MRFKEWFIYLIPVQAVISCLIAAMAVIFALVELLGGGNIPLKNIIGLLLCIVHWIVASRFLGEPGLRFVLRCGLTAGSFFGLMLATFGVVNLSKMLKSDVSHSSLWIGVCFLAAGGVIYEAGVRLTRRFK